MNDSQWYLSAGAHANSTLEMWRHLVALLTSCSSLTETQFIEHLRLPLQMFLLGMCFRLEYMIYMAKVKHCVHKSSFIFLFLMIIFK